MSYAALLAQTVTITTVATGPVDVYGNPTYPTTTTTSLGRLDQVQTVERVNDRDVTVTRDVLFLPADAVVTAKDTVEVDGRTFQVDGTPSKVWGRSAVHHLEVPLREVTA